MRPFASLERVLERAEACADETRHCWRLSGPLSPFEIARLLRIEVILDRHMPVRGMTAEGEPIWLREGDRQTRLNQVCAHELGHHLIYDPKSVHVERGCDRFAAALMMPRAEFAETVSRIGADPLALAKVWRHSSAEAIARRIAEVVPGCCSAGWLELNTKWREGHSRLEVRAELEAVSEAYCRPRGVAVVEHGAGITRVWRTGSTPRSAVSVAMAA